MALQCAAKLCFSSIVDMTWRSMAAAVALMTRSKSSICTHDVLIQAFMYTTAIQQFCNSLAGGGGGPGHAQRLESSRLYAHMSGSVVRFCAVR